jgi:hypothetical protein
MDHIAPHNAGSMSVCDLRQKLILLQHLNSTATILAENSPTEFKDLHLRALAIDGTSVLRFEPQVGPRSSGT